MPGVDPALPHAVGSALRTPHELSFARPIPTGSGGHVAELASSGGRTHLRWRGPALVGVLNVTPDSFSDGGRWTSAGAAVARGLELAQQGALLVDVGGESTRPGADAVDAATEAERVLPVVRGLAAEGVRVSIDTRKPEVARAALAAGACLVNDVTGLRDPAMVAVCAESGAPAIVMHMRGEPRTMQRRPRYDDVVAEVEAFLLERAAAALEGGIPDVVLDPGFGFGKDVDHNLALLRATPRLASHGRAVLIGASRKSTIARLAGVDDPAERLPGTLALHLYAARAGAALLRVHDVAEHRQALAVWAAVEG